MLKCFLIAAFVTVATLPAVAGAIRPVAASVPVAQQLTQLVATVEKQLVQPKKAPRQQKSTKPKAGQERWLNPQPEPPSPRLNPQPEPPSPRLNPQPEPPKPNIQVR